MPHTTHKKKVTVSDDFRLTFKVGTCASILLFIVGMVWYAAIEWSNLQHRLTNLEETQAWHTTTIKTLKK